MKLDELRKRLEDDRCGLFILAGLDRSEGRGDVVTVHAARDSLSPENRSFIEGSVAGLDPEAQVRFRFHASDDLHAPDSLEAFAALFDHDHIAHDPTGAFGRVSRLLRLSGVIRADLGVAVRSILWQPHASALVVVTRDADSPAPLEASIRSLIDRTADADLRKTIRSVRVSAAAPAGCYAPVDALSRATPRGRSRLMGLLARVSGMAALVGLGTMTAAHAAVPPADMDEHALMPGIVALVDLTTLGENVYGGRNQFQAVGGLRLYFGPSGVLKVSAFRPGGATVGAPEGDGVEPAENVELAMAGPADGAPEASMSLPGAIVPDVPISLPWKAGPAVQMPVRIAYGC